jgi:hypothetical protein
MIFKTMRRFAKKAFSSKTYVLAGVNRLIPDTFGTMTDLEIDRENKRIDVQLHRGEARASLHVGDYAIRYRGSRSYLTFGELRVEGFLKSHLKKEIREREIEIEKRYIKAVKTLIRA